MPQLHALILVPTPRGPVPDPLPDLQKPVKHLSFCTNPLRRQPESILRRQEITDSQITRLWTLANCIGANHPEQLALISRDRIAVIIPACHAGDRGSTPRHGVWFYPGVARTMCAGSGGCGNRRREAGTIYMRQRSATALAKAYEVSVHRAFNDTDGASGRQGSGYEQIVVAHCQTASSTPDIPGRPLKDQRSTAPIALGGRGLVV